MSCGHASVPSKRASLSRIGHAARWAIFGGGLRLTRIRSWFRVRGLEAVDYAFSGMDIDYAMLVKLCGESPEPEKRYSPAHCIGCKRTVVLGDPDPAHISTSY